MFSSSSRGNRGKAFTMEDYQILCNAWLEVSQDPIYGINQKKDKLCDRIYEVFDHNKPNSGRISKSLHVVCHAL